MNPTKKLFDDCIAEIPEETKQEIALSFAISNKIYEILKEQHLSQKIKTLKIMQIIGKQREIEEFTPKKRRTVVRLFYSCDSW